MTALWQTLLATPMWLKLLVILIVALSASFPVAALAFVRTEAGRALLLGVIAIAAICWFRASAFTAGRTAERTVWEGRMVAAAFKVAQDTIKADSISAQASDTARRATGARTANINARRAAAEGYAREPRSPVPAVCPVGDPRVVRESQDAASRITATEDRLRSFRPAPGDGAASARTR